MSSQLFAVTGFKDGTINFINPAHVLGVAPKTEGGTVIEITAGTSFVTNDDIKDVVNRYQAAIRSPNGHAGILIQMNVCTGGKTL